LGQNPLSAIEVSHFTVFTFLNLMPKPNWKKHVLAQKSHSKFSINNQMGKYLWADTTALA
jgi:hypothetical protein